MQRQLISLLTIAGSDSSGGAGIQADIKTATMRHVYASSVITAVTAQNSKGVSHVTVMQPDCVERQLKSVFEDCRPDVIKIGMIGSVSVGKVITSAIDDLADDIPIVVDPVMRASMGGKFNYDEDNIVGFYRNELCPRATVVTPNLCEAAVFTESSADAETIAQSLLLMFKCKAVALKGGHSNAEIVSDILAYLDHEGNAATKRIAASRSDCVNLHGTGCVFSTLMAVEIAKGKSLCEAFVFASYAMKAIIADSADYKLGNSPYGPLNIADYLSSMNLQTDKYQ